MVVGRRGAAFWSYHTTAVFSEQTVLVQRAYLQGRKKSPEQTRWKSEQQELSLKMGSHTTSSSSPPSSSPPSSSPSLSRLQSIANHMAAITTTSFPAEAVPQAPEDPLFGLMRACKADNSPDKVDLVGHNTIG